MPLPPGVWTESPTPALFLRVGSYPHTVSTTLPWEKIASRPEDSLKWLCDHSDSSFVANPANRIGVGCGDGRFAVTVQVYRLRPASMLVRHQGHPENNPAIRIREQDPLLTLTLVLLGSLSCSPRRVLACWFMCDACGSIPFAHNDVRFRTVRRWHPLWYCSPGPPRAVVACSGSRVPLHAPHLPRPLRDHALAPAVHHTRVHRIDHLQRLERLVIPAAASTGPICAVVALSGEQAGLPSKHVSAEAPQRLSPPSALRGARSRLRRAWCGGATLSGPRPCPSVAVTGAACHNAVAGRAAVSIRTRFVSTCRLKVP